MSISSPYYVLDEEEEEYAATDGDVEPFDYGELHVTSQHCLFLTLLQTRTQMSQRSSAVSKSMHHLPQVHNTQAATDTTATSSPTLSPHLTLRSRSADLALGLVLSPETQSSSNTTQSKMRPRTIAATSYVSGRSSWT